MTASLRPHHPHRSRKETAPSRPRRAPWRQRLVEAERGVTLGLRGDSTLFAHFFSGSVILATAVVLGLPPVEWAVLIMALAVVLAAELFNKVLSGIARCLDDQSPEALANTLQIGTAAVLVTIVGALASIGLLFGRRIWDVFLT